MVRGTVPAAERTVYNLEVLGHHTYFVGDDGVWVHNTGCPTGPGVYQFPTPDNIPYTGQTIDAAGRLGDHLRSGLLGSLDDVTFKSMPGSTKTQREIMEHNLIQQITGGVPARISPAVANKRDPIGPRRSHLLDPP